LAEDALGGTKAARGEHNSTAELGLNPLPAQDSQAAALAEAIASLSATACRELYALMRIGQGDLAAKQWHDGLSETDALGQDAITTAPINDTDLRNHLAKGLYEVKISL
jgi:hypothetical protein